MVESEDGRQVPVVQAYAFGKYLGYLKVTFDPEGTVLGATGNPILLNSSIPQGRSGRPWRLLQPRPHHQSLPDPEVLAEVEDWKRNLANFSRQQLGRTLVFLDGTNQRCRFGECNLGNLICDAMVGVRVRVWVRFWVRASDQNPVWDPGPQLHQALGGAPVEPGQRRHLQRRRDPILHRRALQQR